LTQAEDRYRVPVTIVDVPSEVDKNAGYCLVACTYMVLRYYEKRGILPRSTPLPSYTGFKSMFGRYVGTLGVPPNKLNDYLREAFPKEDFRVQHRAGNVESLEYHIRSKTPVIPLFDYLMYQQGTGTAATHTTVLIGYTAETLLSNNPLHGKRYPYVKEKFTEAWAQKKSKYILITPRGVTLNSFLGKPSVC